MNFWKHVVLIVVGIGAFVLAALAFGDDPSTMGMIAGAGALCMSAGDPRKLLKAGPTEMPWWQHAVLLALGAVCVVVSVKVLHGSPAIAKGGVLAAGGACLLAGDPWHMLADLAGGGPTVPPAPPAPGAA